MTDQALLLDVNRRVGPQLVAAPRLQQAITGLDPATGHARGLLLVD